MGIFTRAHRKSGILGLSLGSAYGFTALLDREIHDIAWLPWWFTGRWEAFPWAMLFTITGMIVTTLLLGKQKNREGSLESSGWLQSSREALPPFEERPSPEVRFPWPKPGWLAAVLLGITAYLVFGLFW